MKLVKVMKIRALGYAVEVKVHKLKRSAQQLFDHIEYEFAHDESVVAFITTPKIAKQVVALLDAEYQERLDEAEDEDKEYVYRYPYKIERIGFNRVKMTVGWFDKA